MTPSGSRPVRVMEYGVERRVSGGVKGVGKETEGESKKHKEINLRLHATTEIRLNHRNENFL